MSDLAAAAAAIGAPEELVARSAAARAAATGTTSESVLAAWGGGAPAPAAPAPAEAEDAAADTQVTEAPAASEPIAEVPVVSEAPSPVAQEAAPVVIAAPAIDIRTSAAPLLTGRVDRVWSFMFSVSVLFVLGIIFAVGLPAQDGVNIAEEQLAMVPFSTQALTGRDIYEREGCFYCHTQQVRSVVTDVNLGKVSEPGSSISFGSDNFGFQRIGPDLTHVGSREPTNDAQWLENFLTAPRTVHEDSLQPSYAYLSEADMSALVQYLLELE